MKTRQQLKAEALKKATDMLRLHPGRVPSLL
jgi:hypothetical protein